MEMDGTLVESLGFETKDDIYCRKFKMTQEIDVVNKTNGGNGSMKVDFFIWEDYGARRLHRLEFWVRMSNLNAIGPFLQSNLPPDLV